MSLFVLSAALSFALGFFAFRELSRLGLIDQPNLRSSHAEPTVRGGGVAVMKTVLLGLGLIAVRRLDSTAFIILCAAAILAVVSFADDWKSLRASVRFLFHALAACAALYAFRSTAPAFTLSSELSWAIPPLLATILAFLWFAGYTNAFNFMDGINGIAAAQALVTSLGTVFLIWLATDTVKTTPALAAQVIAGAALGFLPHNFPRARMFMGDVSSAPLGFLLAVVTIWSAHVVGWWLLVPLVLLHANFVLDTGITLLRRLIRGERWYAPHREHFYQRLIRSGKSHAFVTTAEVALQLVVIAALAFYIKADTHTRFALIGLILLLWTAFFAYAEATFNRFQSRPMNSAASTTPPPANTDLPRPTLANSTIPTPPEAATAPNR